MPHLHLQTTENVLENSRIGSILESLIFSLCEFDCMNPAAVKAYHSARTVWRMGQGAKFGFVHLEIVLLGGREMKRKIEIADHMFLALQAEFSESTKLGLAGVTVDVREMEPQTYRK